jgi:enamine deaminase RidA (YjgF/YER057c/UK114 family)
MAHEIVEIGIARQIGAYSDALKVSAGSRWLFTSGTPGLAASGALPDDVSGQAELAWQHIVHLLREADMTVADIVKATHYLTRAEDIPAYVQVRSRFLREARPASMLLVIPQLVRPEFLVEIEVVAARGCESLP